MPSFGRMGAWLLATCIFTTRHALAADVDIGYNVYSAAQAMVNLASHSWEWGTVAEALLELYNPELSVFGANPFPNGKIPKADATSFALKYAKQFIHVNGQVLVGDAAVGDPASLGVSAILLGQSDKAYLDASDRQADYILNQAPKYSNGAISHRPDVAELWADNLAMSFPFLAYLAVQKGDTNLMATTVAQCGLQRAILKGNDLNWRHIIGPQSQDTGLWSTGNGWAAYGMVRVLHTLQKWSGSSSMSSQAIQLKTWIKEILDGALLSGFDGGLLHNYLDDDGWFGEISGTALLTAVTYRMAVNDPAMFPQKYITWADTNRKSLAKYQSSNGNGIFAPAVNPYKWLDRVKYTSGSPEGQAFMVYLYTAYRDCVGAGVCTTPSPSVTTISKGGLGPYEILTVLDAPITFTSMPTPTEPACASPQSCDANGCNGSFKGLTKYATCQAGALAGCRCLPTTNTCGDHQSCDSNGCAGKFNGLVKYAQCTGNFEGCECTATAKTCGDHQSCDLNGCAGKFSGLAKYAQCTGNFEGCECSATTKTCGERQSCDLNGCVGKFNGLVKYAQCSGNFEGCECAATSNTCGTRQSCDMNGCAGKFNGLVKYAQCSGNFEGCECTATSNTCGAQQSCDSNGCAGSFDLSNGKAYCTGNFVKCPCKSTPNTCGKPQGCDLNNCAGKFDIGNGKAYCSNYFQGCECQASAITCGSPQSCDKNNCAGKFDLSNGKPYCSNYFQGCECQATPATCGSPQSCDLNSCAGGWDNQGVARCQGKFKGCQCSPTTKTCGTAQSCSLNNCNGKGNGAGGGVCTGWYAGCSCVPSTSTPNYCGQIVSCAWDGCQGKDTGGTLGQCQEANHRGCACSWPSAPPPPPPPPPEPEKRHINVGYLDDQGFDGQEIVTREIDFVWFDGDDACKQAASPSQRPFAFCGVQFCLPGMCGFTVEGCGGNLWINRYGEWWMNCRELGGAEPWGGFCAYGANSGWVWREWACFPGA